MSRLLLFILIFSSISFVHAQSIEFGKIEIKYDVQKGNKKGIEIRCKEIRIKDKQADQIAFGVNIKQKKWLKRSWKKSKTTRINKYTYIRKNISFFYSYDYLSANGDTSQKFKGWFHVVNKKNDTLENIYFSFFYKEGYNNNQPVSRKQTRWLKVVPVSGIIGLDFFVAPYMDHNSEKEKYYDFMGKQNAYDGHKGTDFAIPSFQEMDIGVPIVAAADGIVTEIKDGLFDRNIEGRGQPGNFVIIRHDYNRISYYWHFRKNSIVVKPGDVVRAGQQLGLVGSSGNSKWPHLHFQISEDGQAVDPFSGKMNRQRSRWIKQPKYIYPMTIVDGGIFIKNSSLPYAPIRETYIKDNEIAKMKFWVFVLAQTPGTQRTWKLIDPNGKVKKTWRYKLTKSFNISKSWWYLSRVKYFSGIWNLQVFHNNKLSADFSFQIYKGNEYIKKTNQFQLINNSRMSTLREYKKVLKCEVPYTTKLSNPSLGATEYKYIWYLGHKLIRETISASRRDYLPFPLNNKNRISCKVYKR